MLVFCLHRLDMQTRIQTNKPKSCMFTWISLCNCHCCQRSESVNLPPLVELKLLIVLCHICSGMDELIMNGLEHFFSHLAWEGASIILKHRANQDDTDYILVTLVQAYNKFNLCSSAIRPHQFLWFYGWLCPLCGLGQTSISFLVV